jgi:hypothetical protein
LQAQVSESPFFRLTPLSAGDQTQESKTKNTRRWEMKTKTLLTAGILATTVLSGAAYARGISVNMWDDTNIQQPSPNTGSSVSILNPQDIAPTIDLGMPTLSLTGITSLSFSPGLASSPYLIATSGDLVEYSWGGIASSSSPPDASEQVVIAPGSSGAFSVEFGYDNGLGKCTSATVCGSDSFGAGETASLTVVTAAGTTKYTATDPYKLSDDAGVLSFNKDGSLQSGSGIGWIATPNTSTNAAPEIDPVSAASALTLLAGFLAVMFGKVPRTLMEPKRS